MRAGWICGIVDLWCESRVRMYANNADNWIMLAIVIISLSNTCSRVEPRPLEFISTRWKYRK